MHTSRTCVDSDLVILIVAIVPKDLPSGGCGAVLAGGGVNSAPGHREIIVRVGAACCDVEVVPQ